MMILLHFPRAASMAKSLLPPAKNKVQRSVQPFPIFILIKEAIPGPAWLAKIPPPPHSTHTHKKSHILPKIRCGMGVHCINIILTKRVLLLRIEMAAIFIMEK